MIFRTGPWSSCHSSIPVVRWLSSGCLTTTLPLWHSQHLAVIWSTFVIFLAGFSQAKWMGKPTGKVASHSSKLLTTSAWKRPSLAWPHPGPTSQATHVPSPAHYPSHCTLPTCQPPYELLGTFLTTCNLHLMTATGIARIAVAKRCSHTIWLFLTASVSNGNSGHNLFLLYQIYLLLI